MQCSRILNLKINGVHKTVRCVLSLLIELLLLIKGHVFGFLL